MLVDAIRRMDRVRDLASYQYVGFGSPYFADFSLFHRTLGISRMICIEREQKDADRFNFNVPFGAVELRFGEASDVLPQLDWEQPSIVWLDYDGRLDESKLSDIGGLIQGLPSGSLFLASFSVEPPELADRKRILLRDLGSALPLRYTDELLGGWGTADACWTAVSERIRSDLALRNLSAPAGEDVAFEQTLHFRYSDGSKMMTVGGLLVDTPDAERFRACSLDELEFTRRDSLAFEITVPRLTLKEMRHLEGLLPAASTLAVGDTGIPPREAEAFRTLYRYFPKYVDVEI